MCDGTGNCGIPLAAGAVCDMATKPCTQMYVEKRRGGREGEKKIAKKRSERVVVTDRSCRVCGANGACGEVSNSISISSVLSPSCSTTSSPCLSLSLLPSFVLV